MKKPRYITNTRIVVSGRRNMLMEKLGEYLKPSTSMPGFYTADTFDIMQVISGHMTGCWRGFPGMNTIYFYVIIRDKDKGEFLVINDEAGNYRFIGGPIFEPHIGCVCPKSHQKWDEFDLFNQAFESAVAGLSTIMNYPYGEPLNTYSPTWGLDDFREWTGWRTIGLDSHRTPAIFEPFNLSVPRDSVYIPEVDIDDMRRGTYGTPIRLFKIVDVPLAENVYPNVRESTNPIQVLNRVSYTKIKATKQMIADDTDGYRHINGTDMDIVTDLLRV